MQRFAISDLPVTPWKNGGGGTREVVCRPEGAGIDSFDWRVSIATIAQAGPFSAFPGIDRVIMLLAGDGVRLQANAAGIEHLLDQPGIPFSFAGDVALDCALLGGTSTDFNVMTRRGAVRADVQVLKTATDLPAANQGLLLALQGGWLLCGEQAKEEIATGHGLWWEGPPMAWRAEPLESSALLVWVRLETLEA